MTVRDFGIEQLPPQFARFSPPRPVDDERLESYAQRLIDNRIVPRQSTARNLARYLGGVLACEPWPADVQAISRQLGVGGQAYAWLAANWQLEKLIELAGRDLSPAAGVLIDHGRASFTQNTYDIVSSHAFDAGWSQALSLERVSAADNDAPDGWKLAYEDVVDRAGRAFDVFPPLIAVEWHTGQFLRDLLQQTGLQYFVEVDASYTDHGLAPLDPLELWPAPIAAYMRDAELDSSGLGFRHMRHYGRFKPSPEYLEIGIVDYAGDTPRYALARLRISPEVSGPARYRVALERLKGLTQVWRTWDMRAVATDFGLDVFHCPGEESWRRHAALLADFQAFLHAVPPDA